LAAHKQHTPVWLLLLRGRAMLVVLLVVLVLGTPVAERVADHAVGDGGIALLLLLKHVSAAAAPAARGAKLDVVAGCDAGRHLDALQQPRMEDCPVLVRRVPEQHADRVVHLDVGKPHRVQRRRQEPARTRPNQTAALS
jgi:hypothetical protein